MTTESYDYQWMPNVIDDDYSTLCNIDKSIANQYPLISQLCVSFIDSKQSSNDGYFSFANVMSDIDLFKLNNVHDRELQEKILVHKKNSSSGFNSLQRRIERVKNDLKSLTSKLNTDNLEETENGLPNHSYYNLSQKNITENVKDKNEECDESKSTTCSGKLYTKNPFSELSVNTQKILSKLRLQDIESYKMESTDFIDDEEDDFQMEEDELEFTFTNRKNNLINPLFSKGTLTVIEEQEEENSSSDESESAKSTVIERIAETSDTGNTDNCLSMHSFDLSDGDIHESTRSDGNAQDVKEDLEDNTEECFSDFAKCSSRESVQSNGIDCLDSTCPERTIMADIDHDVNDKNLEEKSSSFVDENEEFASEAEYDDSAWSTDDIPQSVDQSDSLYDKPYRPRLKASLPDLLESSDSHDIDTMGGSLTARHFNKSTDLDEIILSQTSPYHDSSDGRLSQSLCNLFTKQLSNIIRPDSFFQERASFENLLETDLDSGYVSIYKPVTETAIQPKVDFSSSMGNVSQVEMSRNGFPSSLANRLRNKAGSITELRIADSLAKLNIPTWLNLREEVNLASNNHANTFPTQSTPSRIADKSLLTPQRRMRTFPSEIPHNSSMPIIKSKPVTPVILPSEILRQSSQRKLTPIKFCQARLFLLPNKVTVKDCNNSPNR